MQPHRYDWSFGMRKNGGTETDTQRREKKQERDDADVKRNESRRKRNAQGNFLLYWLINGGR